VIAAASDTFAPTTLYGCLLGLLVLPLWWRWMRRRELAPVTPVRSSMDAIWPVPVGFAVMVVYMALLALAVGAVKRSQDAYETAQIDDATSLLWMARIWIGVAVVMGLAIAAAVLPRLSRSSVAVPHAIALGVLTFLAALPVVYGIAYVESLLFGELPPQKMVEMIGGSAEGSRELVLLAIIVAPLLEEIVFRGFFWAGLRRTRGPRFALIFTAILFGLVHVPPVAAVLPLAALGVFLAVLMERTGSVLACFVTHAAFNSFSVAALVLG